MLNANPFWLRDFVCKATERGITHFTPQVTALFGRPCPLPLTGAGSGAGAGPSGGDNVAQDRALVPQTSDSSDKSCSHSSPASVILHLRRAGWDSCWAPAQNFHCCHCLNLNLCGPDTARAPLCSSWQSKQPFVACTWLYFLLNAERIDFFDNIKNIQIKMLLLFLHELEITFHFCSEFTAVPLKHFWKTSTPA